jgi:hypothetical protein
MSRGDLEEKVRNIDTRVARIEQMLPTVATREQLSAAKEELRAAIALLATREEMHAAIRAEGEAARHHAALLFEDLRDDNRIMLEHLVALSARVDQLARR